MLRISHTNATFTSGYAGFRGYDVSGKVDDVEITDAETTYYLRGADGAVLAEYDASGALKAEYAYANGQRVAILRPGQPAQHYLTDQLGSARRLYPIVSGWASDYYPFGQVEAQTGSESETRFGYTGHETDFATELVYAGARYYDAEVGRWLQVDPLADAFPGWTPYNYAFNNPLESPEPLH